MLKKNTYTAYCVRTHGLAVDQKDAERFAYTLVPPKNCEAAIHTVDDSTYLVFSPLKKGEANAPINLDDYEHFATLNFHFSEPSDAAVFEDITEEAADSVLLELSKYIRQRADQIIAEEYPDFPSDANPKKE